jgi:hypothetical protein
MIKRMLLFIALVATVGTALPNKAVADRCTRGRITDLTADSMSVFEDETLTFTLDSRTHYTKWITTGPWQQQTELSAYDLEIGRLVYVHQRHDGTNAARWVQIATDVPDYVPTYTPTHIH